MSVEFKAIERPPSDRNDLYGALVDTVMSGKALLITLNGQSLVGLQCKCRQAMRIRGFNYH